MQLVVLIDISINNGGMILAEYIDKITLYK